MKCAGWLCLLGFVGLGLAGACSGGGATGSSGDGGVGGCKSDADCGLGNGCTIPVCKEGVCGEEYVTEGKAILWGYVAGDCRKQECGPEGTIVDLPDPDDVDDDHNPCTLDTCEGDAPTHVPDPMKLGTPCGAGGGQLACSMDGKCTGCNNDDQCPSAGICTKPICATQAGTGVCTVAIDVNKEVSNQDTTDCFKAVCNDKGQLVPIPATTDVPTQDDNPCDTEVCGADGLVKHQTLPDGTACGMSTTCNPSTCTVGKCVVQPAPAGTPDSTQTMGDCKRVVCDGMGGTTTQIDDTDPPADPNMNDCTRLACTDGVVTLANEPGGKTCVNAFGELSTCDGNGNCQ